MLAAARTIVYRDPARASSAQRRRHRAPFLRHCDEPLSARRRPRAEPPAQHRSRRDLGRGPAGLDAVARTPFRRRLRRRHARADAAWHRAARRDRLGEGAGALARCWPAARADRAAPRAAVRPCRAALSRACAILAARNTGAQLHRRHRRRAHCGGARRGRAALAPRAAALRPGADHRRGQRRHGGGRAGRGGALDAPRRAAHRRGGACPVGDCRGIADLSGMNARINWFWYASPQTFFPLAGAMAPWFGAAAAILGAIGLYIGLFVAPTDAQQGEAYRILFIHVPAAWMSMFIYVVMAGWGAPGVAFHKRRLHLMGPALPP